MIFASGWSLANGYTFWSTIAPTPVVNTAGHTEAGSSPDHAGTCAQHLGDFRGGVRARGLPAAQHFADMAGRVTRPARDLPDAQLTGIAEPVEQVHQIPGRTWRQIGLRAFTASHLTSQDGQLVPAAPSLLITWRKTRRPVEPHLRRAAQCTVFAVVRWRIPVGRYRAGMALRPLGRLRTWS